MYRSHYSLARKPFQLTTDPKFLWLGEKHKEALATLKYGVIDQKGFLLVTGDVGTGKTTLINALLESIEEDTLVANITDPALNLIEFFNFVALSFDISQKFESKIDFIFYFSRFLKKVYSENKSVLLIIDEVHRLSKEILEHIRLLSNIELPKEKLINIFFVGQNEIHHTLALPECRALRQRISLVYHIEPLSENETLEYIKHRLKVAGTEKNIFTQNAVGEIYHFSKGYPRLINTICDHALLTGYARDLKKITPDVILECAQQFNYIDDTQTDNHPISNAQHHPECRSHSITCPFLKDSAGEMASSENTGARVFILSQAESFWKQINAQEGPQNNTLDSSQLSTSRRLQKSKFFWTSVASFAKRIQKELFSGASAITPFIKRIPKTLYLWISVALSFLKRMHKKLFSRVSAASAAAFFRKRWFFWTSAITLVMMVLIIASRYQTAVTSKNDSPEPTSPALKTTPSSPNHSEGPLTSHTIQTNDSKTSTDKTSKAPSLQKTEISKPDVLEQAKTALVNKNFNRAIELFEQVIARHPGNVSTIRRYYSRALQGQADSIFFKTPDKAEILLSKAVEADPQNAEAHFDLGRLYTKSKSYSKAIKAYKNAANLNHRPSDAFYNLGFIYASMKDFANAEKMFLDVVDLKPTYLDKALFNLALVQQKLGKRQQCIDNLEKALKNNPENQRAQEYLNQLKNEKEVP